MTTMVLGASGATGQQLVQQLLLNGEEVKVIVRAPSKLPESWKSNGQLSIIQASVLDINEDEMARHLEDCRAVACCLGHNLSFKGIYGSPRKLVRDAVILLCNSIKKNASEKPVKLVLMNTAGNQNRDLDEPISRSQKIVVGIIRFLLPPHSDNENAADYLRTQISRSNKYIEWAAVRPDDLINTNKVTEYEVFPSPIRSAIFNAGKTSRINVGHFMCSLITNDNIWDKWKGQMPVIYNIEDDKNKK